MMNLYNSRIALLLIQSWLGFPYIFIVTTGVLQSIPEDLYERHILIESGNSSFKKVMDKSKEKVLESLYLSW